MPSSLPRFWWYLIDLYSGSDEKGAATRSRSSLARSLFNVCGMMFMAVSPYGDARPAAGRAEPIKISNRHRGESRSRPSTRRRFPAVAAVAGALERRRIVEGRDDAEAILARKATERMAGKRRLLFRSVGRVGRMTHDISPCVVARQCTARAGEVFRRRIGVCAVPAGTWLRARSDDARPPCVIPRQVAARFCPDQSTCSVENMTTASITKPAMAPASSA